MRRRQWWALLGLIVLGGLLGAGAMIVSIEVTRHTSTDAFCTSCHSMGHLAADPFFVASRHRSSPAGALASCADCHIPRTNWFVETYAHAAGSIRDVIAEQTHDFADPVKWEQRRIALAHEVRDEMRRADSVTCRSCHTEPAIRPASARGRAAHALLADRRMTCVDCHFNLAHAPVPPSPDFLRGSGLGIPRK